MKDFQLSRRDFARTGLATLFGGALLSNGKAAQAPVSDRPGWSGAWHPVRPQRLSDSTRSLAERALAGEHGRALEYAQFDYDRGGTAGLCADRQYGLAMRALAEKAPLRILPGERLVGSATLREAAEHRMPLLGVSSVSHTTLGFERALSEGMGAYRRRIKERLARGGFDKGEQTTLAVESTPTGQAICTSPGAASWMQAPVREETDGPGLAVEVRFRALARPTYNLLVANRTKASTRHWEIYTTPERGALAAYLPGFGVDLSTDVVAADGAWHTARLELGAQKVRLFLDGALAGEAEGNWAAPSGASGGDALWIGAYPPNSMGCSGAIESVSIQRTGGHALAQLTVPVSATDSTDHLIDTSGSGNHARVPPLPGNGEDLLIAMLDCLDGLEIWHRRHIEELDRLITVSEGEDRENYRKVRANLAEIPNRPPRTFHEAVQSLWFLYAYLRLAGTWSGIGRIDEMLGPYLEQDLADGRLTLGEAREILAHFWIKGVEWTGSHRHRGSGDAQFYQNIILAGVNAQGREITNQVTYLVLDIVEELNISDFPIAIRLNQNTPRRLIERAVEVQRHGGGIVAFYNEDVVIDGLTRFGYPLEVARTFTNDGCWETLIPGKTCFSYYPFDALALLHDALGLNDPDGTVTFDSFDDLYAAWQDRLAVALEHFHTLADGWPYPGPPCPLVSLFVDDCIENAKGYYDGGPRYTVLSPHAGGLANVADSLLTIRRLIFEERSLTCEEFFGILRKDWKGQEPLRRLIRSRLVFYGNDDDAADAMMRRVFDDYTEIAGLVRERNGVLRPAGISTFGREIQWAAGESPPRAASPDGHHRGDVLATNFSPSPGSDTVGPTAALKSYCSMDFTRTPNGATLELKLHPDSVKGDRGRDTMVALARSFVRLEGWFLHVDVVDSTLLIDAQRHPDKYPNLTVRLSGWSARFATLNTDWQNMVIQRTEQYFG